MERCFLFFHEHRSMFFIFTGSKAQCYGECAGLPVKRTGFKAWLGLCALRKNTGTLLLFKVPLSPRSINGCQPDKRLASSLAMNWQPIQGRVVTLELKDKITK